MANNLEVIMKHVSPYILLSGILLSGTVLAGEKIDSSLSADGVSGVSIENIRGHVTVIGSDRNTVSVKGELEDDVEKFTFEQSGNQILIKVRAPQRNRSNNKDGSHFTVQLPDNMRVNFQGVSSHFTASDIAKSVEARTVSGDIEATNLTQVVELESVSGDIVANALSGKIRLSSVSGDIKDRDSSGRIELKAVSGSIDTISSATDVSLEAISGEMDFKLANVDDLSVNVISGDAEGKVNLADAGRVRMSGVSADLEISFQDNVQASFNLSASAGGKIVNDLTDDRVVKAKYGPSSRIKFSTGNGSASVKASVVSGTIKVSSH